MCGITSPVMQHGMEGDIPITPKDWSLWIMRSTNELVWTVLGLGCLVFIGVLLSRSLMEGRLA